MKEIILPSNSGLRDAYVAIMKEMYAIQQDMFWMQDVIDIISIDCGISIDNAKDKFKQLVRFRLIKYLYSSLSGHRYIVLIYSKNQDDNGMPSYIDNWLRFNQLIEKQFPDMVVDDLVWIRRSVNISCEPSFEAPVMRDQTEKELEKELEKLDTARIIKPGEDVIKNVFKTLVKESHNEAVENFEKALRVSSGNEGSEKNMVFEGE